MDKYSTLFMGADGNLRTLKGELVDFQYMNAMGVEIDITTLTGIKQKTVSQSFYEIAFADFAPVIVGENSWCTNLLTYVDYSTSRNFEDGIIHTSSDNSRLPQVHTAVEGVSVPVKNWAKGKTYSIIDLNTAAKAGNWSLIERLEKSQKADWDLGLQRVAFLGLETDSTITGMLNMSGVNVNTTLIAKPLSSMSAAELQTFITGAIAAYCANCNYTRMPDRFIIPLSDFLGLAAFVSSDFPLTGSTKIECLLNAFKQITGNPNFKILPVAYCQASLSNSALSVNRYMFTRYDEETLRMDIPVDYTTTVPMSLDNFHFQNAVYGQFTGFYPYKTQETLYIDETPVST